MADEKTGSAMKWVKILFGILVILAGLFLTWTFWPEFWAMFKGIIGVVLIIVGIIIAAIGWTD
ncbi:MAG: hypothetical protein V1839_00270 [archaeon]